MQGRCSYACRITKRDGSQELDPNTCLLSNNLILHIAVTDSCSDALAVLYGVLVLLTPLRGCHKGLLAEHSFSYLKCFVLLEIYRTYLWLPSCGQRKNWVRCCHCVYGLCHLLKLFCSISGCAYREVTLVKFPY